MRYIDLGFCTEVSCVDALPVVIPEKILKGHASLFSFLNADLVSVDSALERHYASGDPGEKETVFNMISSLHPWFSMNKANASALMNQAAAAPPSSRPATNVRRRIRRRRRTSRSW